MKKIILAAACMAFLGACQKSSATFSPDCGSTVKSFATDVLPVMNSKCAGCHGQFSSYSQIAGDKANIRSQIADGTMPRGASLSTTEKNNIICWIDNGALNN